MKRERLRAAIETALSEYAGTVQANWARIHCHREIDALIARADYTIRQHTPGETIETPEEEKPWPALRMARGL